MIAKVHGHTIYSRRMIDIIHARDVSDERIINFVQFSLNTRHIHAQARDNDI